VQHLDDRPDVAGNINDFPDNTLGEIGACYEF
jgi:hypothetical protein